MNTGIVIVAVLALLGALWAFNSGAKAGRTIERRSREISRTGQVLLTSGLVGAVIAVTQWVVMTHVVGPSFGTVALVLGVPGLLAGITVGRLVTITTTIEDASHGARRKGTRR
jgi:uncharacterized membrane protein